MFTYTQTKNNFIKANVNEPKEILLQNVYVPFGINKNYTIKFQFSKQNEFLASELTNIDKEHCKYLHEIYFKTDNQIIETPITFSTKKIFGPLIFKNFSSIDTDTKKPQSQWIKPGNQTNQIEIIKEKTNFPNLLISGIWNGILHIIPYGFDHILFVLGLFFFSYKLKPLLIQVTTFTIAHSITLILGGLGYVTISPVIVEAIIAASIIWIGVENLFRKSMNISRIGVIFCFGLLHGLGFASMFKLIGLEGTDYFLNLLSFNVGIEIGQIITLAPLIILIPLFNRLSWYRILIAIPASIIIALFGADMFIDRVL